jgi:hypothetical protein
VILPAAGTERLTSPPTAAFEYGLDLLIDGLRVRYAAPVP